MENLLLIEVFDNKAKCIYKTKKGSAECETLVFDEIKRNLVNINTELFVKIYGTFNANGIVFFPGNVLIIDIFDYQKKVRKKVAATSLMELVNSLIYIDIKGVNRTSLSINNYTQILFEKEVFMTILALTQQYFMFDSLELEKPLNLTVNTSNGIQTLINEGKSSCIMEPIIGLNKYACIEVMSIDSDRLLWALSMNNCFTSINFSTGDYFLSLEVKNANGDIDNIYLMRGCKDFWNSIKVYLNQDNVFFGIDKGVLNSD